MSDARWLRTAGPNGGGRRRSPDREAARIGANQTTSVAGGHQASPADVVGGCLYGVDFNPMASEWRPLRLTATPATWVYRIANNACVAIRPVF